MEFSEELEVPLEVRTDEALVVGRKEETVGLEAAFEVVAVAEFVVVAAAAAAVVVAKTFVAVDFVVGSFDSVVVAAAVVDIADDCCEDVAAAVEEATFGTSGERLDSD
jgi:hypothetical protein